jgi:phosphopantothenoylcysteine decarboxylase / phosphopantothenate---cysteine ligase
VDHAIAKRDRKGADWIVANDVSGPKGMSVMGGSHNMVHLVTAAGVENWPEMPKTAVATRLIERIAIELSR